MASVVAGNVTASIVLIFVSLFAGFYLMQVSYVFMGTTTMLALLYGLLGEFSVALLVTRIEETAIGAAIGILTAVVVLPTRTATTVSADMRSFITALGELLGAASEKLADGANVDLTGHACRVDGLLAALRTSSAPLTTGIAGWRGRGSVRDGLAVSCDRWARGLARIAAPASASAARDTLAEATTCVRHDLEILTAIIDGLRPDASPSADPLLDAAQAGIDTHTAAPDEVRRLTVAVGYLRRIDRAVVGLAADLDRHSSPVLPLTTSPKGRHR